MPRRSGYPSPVQLPSPAERAALAVVARYLARAGSATASHLLCGGADADAALAAVLRDQFEASAALCRGLLDAAADDDVWLLRLP